MKFYKHFITYFDNPKGGMIIGIVVMAVIILLLTRTVNTPDEGETLQPKVCLVEVDYALFQEALSDSCSLKNGKFRCSDQLMANVLRGVDTNCIKRSGNVVTLNKKGAYIMIPATMMANLFDLHLIKESTANESSDD